MDELLTTAVEAARAAGREVMALYETTDFETKGDGSPLTVADTKAHDTLVMRLQKTGVPILSEESTAEASAGISIPYPERLWIIDPIDGTRDFLKKTGDFAVMIGLLEHGRPVLGVVYAPAWDKLYYAVRGEGTHLEHGGALKRLSVSGSGDPLRCIRSVHHFKARDASAIERLGAVTLPHGSIGIKAGLIAEGAGDFSFSWGSLGEWDVCAPEIITTEAGGRVTDTNGNPLFYGTKDHRIVGGMIFSNGACHEEVQRTISSTPLDA